MTPGKQPTVQIVWRTTVRDYQILLKNSWIYSINLWHVLNITFRDKPWIYHQITTQKCVGTAMEPTKIWMTSITSCKGWTDMVMSLGTLHTCVSMWKMQWTSLGSFGAGLSTALFPAVIQFQWLPFHPLSSSYLLFFISVASFTQSRRSGYSFCPNVSSQMPVLWTSKKNTAELQNKTWELLLVYSGYNCVGMRPAQKRS